MEKIQVHIDSALQEELIDKISFESSIEKATTVELINLANQNSEIIKKCYEALTNDEEFSETSLQVYVSEDDYFVKLNGAGFIVEADDFTKALKLILNCISAI